MGNETHERSSAAGRGTDRVRNAIERWVDSAVQEGERVLSDLGWRDTSADWHPDYDVLENETSVLVLIDLPGVSAESIDVHVVGNVLTVSGARPERTPAPGETTHVRKRVTGSFRTTLSMPVPVDREQVSARTDNGVLEIALPKSETTKTRHVPVTTSTAGPSTPPPGSEPGVG